jgi:hypothetical protein
MSGEVSSKEKNGINLLVGFGLQLIESGDFGWSIEDYFIF